MLQTDRDDGLCILRLDAPPLNTLTVELLERLTAAVRQAAADPAVRGIVITGGAEQFSAGADVHLFQEIDSADTARRIARTFQEAFQAIEDSPKPVAAAMAGMVLGGALELALACHIRIAAAGTSFRFPEVTLGINPGAGGTQRLPRLIGLEHALQMLLTGEAVSAATARDWGLVDEVASADRIIESARELLRTQPAPRRTSQLTDKISDSQQLEAGWKLAESQLRKTRPELIAPAKIVAAVRAGIAGSFQHGLEQEREAFADCVAAPAAQNKIHLFFATRVTGKVPELATVAPQPVQLAAVVGMGTMGTGITHALVTAGVPVVVLEQDAAALERGIGRIRDSLQKRVEQGRLASDRAGEILRSVIATTRLEDLAGADLVIESVFEDVAVKRTILAEVEQICSPDAVLATNTSTILLDDLSAGMQNPERLIGMHFFNPAQRMPLVELVRRASVPPAVLATALALARRLRKTPVVVANREGFLVNRIFVPYLQEAFSLWEEGASAEAIDRAAVEFGFPMGPFVLLDMAGLDILVHAQRVLQRAFAQHGPLSPVAILLVEQGMLGQKTGAGVYRYPPGDTRPHPHPAANEIVAAVQRASGRCRRDIDGCEIADRLVLRMVNEAFQVLRDGVAQRASDVDVAMVLGTGFPDFRGGVLKYAADLGRDRVRERLMGLSAQCGERFSPAWD